MQHTGTSGKDMVDVLKNWLFRVTSQGNKVNIDKKERNSLLPYW